MADISPESKASDGGSGEKSSSANNDNGNKAQSFAWRHIGLHGAGMGSLLLHPQYMQWTSGAGLKNNRNMNQDDDLIRKVSADQLKSAQWTVFGRHGYLRVLAAPQKNGSSDDGGSSNSRKNKNPVEYRFDGFPEADFTKLTDIWKDLYGIKLFKKTISSSGASFGTTELEQGKLVFRESIVAEEEGEAESGEEIISLQLNEVSQCVLPGNNRNEIELQFHEETANGGFGSGEKGSDQLVQIRFYVPPDLDADPNDKAAPTAAERMQQSIMSQANVRSSTGDVIAKFDETQGTFLTPRGRYTIELFAHQLRLRGNKYDYKIKYDDISRLFLLPKPDDFHMAFVIALDRPIRQGQQRYKYLVMQTNKQPSEIEIHLDEETLKKEYNGDLQPLMTGSLSNLVAKTFKIVTKKKVFVPGKFANASQQACVKCALKANEGLLYPLEKQFLFIHKPAVLVRFDEIESVEFQRYAGGQGSTRNFDLCVTLHQPSEVSADNASTKEYIFSGIDRSDYTALYNFLSGKKIRVRNLAPGGGSGSLSTFEEAMAGQPMAGGMIPPLQTAAAQAELMAELNDVEGEESSEDEDYNSANDSDKGGGDGEGSSDESMDPDELSDDDALSDDSDLAEYRKAAKKQAKKEGGGGGDDDSKKRKKQDEDDGSSKKEKKKTKSDSPAAAGGVEKKKKAKAKKDPDAPKRATTPYFYFMNEHRERIKSENPDATFGEIGKILGEEYKKLSPEEKKKYEDLNTKDKARYAKEMEAYNAKKKAESGGGDGESSPEKQKAKKVPAASKKKATSSSKKNVDEESAADSDDDESEAESDADSE